MRSSSEGKQVCCLHQVMLNRLLKMIYLVNFSELRNSLAKQGKEFVKMFYPSEELLNQYLKIYGFQNE